MKPFADIVRRDEFERTMGMSAEDFGAGTILVGVTLSAACNNDPNLMVTMLVDLAAAIQLAGGDAETDEENVQLMAQGLRLSLANSRRKDATKN